MRMYFIERKVIRAMIKIKDPKIFYDFKGDDIIKIGKNVTLEGGKEGHIIESPVIIGDDVSLDCKSLGAFTEIGRGTSIISTLRIGRYVNIGNNCSIGEDTSGFKKLTYSDFFTDRIKWGFWKDRKLWDSCVDVPEVIIGNNVRIGDNVTICKGVVIADNVEIPSDTYVKNDIVSSININSEVTIDGRRENFWKLNPQIVYSLTDNLVEYVTDIYYKPAQIVVLDDKILYRESDKEKEIYNHNSNEVLQGGISKKGVNYNAEKKELEIWGWFWPVTAYDEIEIVADNIILGKAELHVLRKDVAKGIGETGIRSGFYFNDNVAFEPHQLEVVLNKNGDCVKRVLYNLTNLPYDIFINNIMPDRLKEFNDQSFRLDCQDDKAWGKVISSFTRVANNSERTIACDNTYELSDDNIFPYWVFLIYNDGYIDYENLMYFSQLLHIQPGFALEKIKKCMNKQIVSFYGNCQTVPLSYMFIESKKLKEKYAVLTLPPIHLFNKYNEYEKGIDEGILNNISIFIYQYINENNAYSFKMSTNYILCRLYSGALRVCIPNCYFIGYYPNKMNYNVDVLEGDVVVIGGRDNNIDSMYQNISKEEIVAQLSNTDFYSKDDVLKHCDQSIQELKNREKKCDIKISDYIEKYYKKQVLFYTRNHPSNQLLYVLLERVLKYLHINEDVYDIIPQKVFDLNHRQDFIYPSVAKALGLDLSNYDYMLCRSLNIKADCVKDYVNVYFSYFIEGNNGNIKITK